MNKVKQSNRWFSAWRATPQLQEADPADMGTCFGLDLSLNPLHSETPPAPAPAAPPTGRGWRLALRRKPAL
jgi:hypothetical protein